MELNCNDWTDEVNNLSIIIMTFLAPFLKINEYNKNTQSNIFNICIQEVIRGCVNWMETNLAIQWKPQNTVFLTMRKVGPEPVIN